MNTLAQNYWGTASLELGRGNFGAAIRELGYCLREAMNGEDQEEPTEKHNREYSERVSSCCRDIAQRSEVCGQCAEKHRVVSKQPEGE